MTLWVCIYFFLCYKKPLNKSGVKVRAASMVPSVISLPNFPSFLIAILLQWNRGSKGLSNLPQIVKLVKRAMVFEPSTAYLRNCFLPCQMESPWGWNKGRGMTDRDMPAQPQGHWQYPLSHPQLESQTQGGLGTVTRSQVEERGKRSGTLTSWALAHTSPWCRFWSFQLLQTSPPRTSASRPSSHRVPRFREKARQNRIPS